MGCLGFDLFFLSYCFGAPYVHSTVFKPMTTTTVTVIGSYLALFAVPSHIRSSPLPRAPGNRCRYPHLTLQLIKLRPVEVKKLPETPQQIRFKPEGLAPGPLNPQARHLI